MSLSERSPADTGNRSSYVLFVKRRPIGTILLCRMCAALAVVLVALAVAPTGNSSGNHGETECPVFAAIPPLVSIVGIPVAVVGCYNVVTGILAARNDRSRDPATGVIDGAEAFDMGPEDAPVAVLLVHGFIGSVRDFGDLPARLAARGYCVRAMRLPGHGTRPQDIERESPDTLIDAVLAEYDALRLTHERVVLAGHSMGGTLAVLAASERDPDALVLAAPYFGVTGKWYYGLNPETWAAILDPFVRWVYKGNRFVQLNRRDDIPKIISYRWVPLKGVKILSELGKRAKREDVLGSIDCQVLVHHSRNDDAASLRESRTAFEAIQSPDKRFIELERSNHLIFLDYERETVIDDIESFIGNPR